ncbi:MAG: RsmB/NOP family class I SAM-dependent RNA methyltransferase [Leptolyngbya sp. SIO4C1]|nr:RsmB/NOP family class I SAM-dependent RNA methyltransferase [Leptolyngbya sp. SIO4C1]
MTQPSNLLLKLSHRLFTTADQQAAFVEALVNPKPAAPAILWTQPRPSRLPFERLEPLPWQPGFCDRLAPSEQPGRHPLHDVGAYYCLDLSSIFAAAVLEAIPSQAIDLAIDLCAAPGGKSLLASHHLGPRRLFCNEVIRKRVRILIANLKRCSVKNATVFNLDPQAVAANIPHSAQVVIVDAPCSGQSLLAKGKKAEGCFHPVILKKNAQRQKRILANAAQLVADGGYLAYMTCTYAPEENEQVIHWLLKKFPGFEAAVIPALAAYQSQLTQVNCYRLWPQQYTGAGAFTALFRKTADESQTNSNSETVEQFIDRSGWLITKNPPQF